jgi:hypothetical protein
MSQQAEPEHQLTPVALRYEDAAQYGSVFKPLVKLEADYDRWVTGMRACARVVFCVMESIVTARVRARVLCFV